MKRKSIVRFRFIALVLSLFPVWNEASYAQSAKQNVWVTDRPVRAMVKSGRTIYIGGDFKYVGPMTGAGVILSADSGKVLAESPLVNGSNLATGVRPEVLTVVSDGDGGWYIGGNFTRVNGIARSNIAYVLSTGEVDAWNPNANGTVRSIVITFDGRAIVGGDFTAIGGVTRNNLAALSRDSGNDVGWNPNPNGSIRVISFDGSTVYLGGTFSRIGSTARTNFAAITIDSLNPLPVNPALNGAVNAIAFNPQTRLLCLGGEFSTINSLPTPYLAVSTNGGTTWSSPSPNATVRTMHFDFRSSTLYIGGDFTLIGTAPRSRLAALINGSALLPWQPAADNTVNALGVSGNTIYIGGAFRSVSAQPRNFMAALDSATGSVKPLWNPVAGDPVGDFVIHPPVSCLAIAGTQVFAGGYFNSVNGVLRNFLAAVLDSTGFPTSWNPGFVDPNPFGGINLANPFGVHALALSGNTLYTGGRFDSVGVPRRYAPRLCAINVSTGSPVALALPVLNGVVEALTSSGGKVFFGGAYTITGANARTHLASFDSISGALTTWNPNPTPTGSGIFALKTAGNSVYAGGGFATIGGQPRNNIAALDLTNGTATTWDPNCGGIVYSIVPAGATVYAGGLFNTVGGQASNSLAALDAITGSRKQFYLYPGLPTINSLALSGNSLYVLGNTGTNTGFLNSINTVTGALSSWGTPLTSIGGSIGVNGPQQWALQISDTSVLAGGPWQHTGVQNDSRSYLVGFGDESLALPAILFSRTSIDLGNVAVGQLKVDSVLITNIGGSPLDISSVSSNNPRFVPFPAGVALGVGQSRYLRVIFTPTTAGIQNAAIAFTHNAQGSPDTVNVNGVGLAPIFSATPRALPFGNVIVRTSKTDSVTVTNTGNLNLIVTTVLSTNTQFQVAPTLDTIPPLVSHRFRITFMPASSGFKTGNVEFSHNAGTLPDTVAVNGTGVTAGFQVAPGSLAFGNVRVGTAKTDSLTVTNTGTVPLIISSAQSSNPQFAAGAARDTLAPNVSKKFSVTFTPSALGSRSDSITFTHNAPGSPTSIRVTGTGALPTFALNSLQVNFGSVVLNSTSLDTSIVVTNIGGLPLTISTVTTSDTQFVPVLTTATIAASGGTRRFPVRFMPRSTGLKSSIIIFVHDAAGSPDTVVVSGTGVNSTFSVQPPSLSFGKVNIGANKLDSLTVFNSSPTAPIDIASVVSGDARFVVLPPTSGAVPAGGSRRIYVRFTPSVAETVNSSITITHNAVGSPTGIEVTGIGFGARFQISRLVLPFGNVRVGALKQDTIVVTNHGTDTLSISDASVTDTRFSVLPRTVRIAPSERTVFTVTFAPTSIVGFGGSLRFAHNSPGSPASIDVSGAGIAPVLAVLPRVILFGEIAVNSSVNTSINLVNSGNANLNIDSVLVRGRDAVDFSIASSRGPFLNIGPGDTAKVILRFGPHTVDTLKAASFLAYSDGLSSPDSAAIRGRSRNSLVQVFVRGDTLLGSPVRLDAQGPPDFIVSRAVLYYRVAGRGRYDTLALAQDATFLTGTLPDSVVTARGVEYYVRLIGVQGINVTEPEVNPQQNPMVLRVKVARFAPTQQFTPRVYRMISIPLELTDPSLETQLVDDYEPYSRTRWRLFRWENDRNVEFPAINKNFKPGNAFWLVTQAGRGFDAKVGKSVLSGVSFAMQLDTGWNQIATPFAFPVAWDSIQNNRLLSTPYLYENGQYTLGIRVLQPWEGYFVYNASQEPVTLLVPPVETPAGLRKDSEPIAAQDEHDLVLQMSASTGNLKDTYNYVGLREDATSGPSAPNMLQPPLIGDYVDLSIIENGRSYAANFKPLSDEGQRWEMRVTSTLPHQTARISLTQTGVLPSGFSVYILDEDEFAVVPLTENPFAIQLGAANSVRSFKVIVGTTTYAERASGGIPLAPIEFSLAQNYPNPFNPTTTIRYSLSKRSVVLLEIFNLLGQKIRTLVSSDQTTGTYSVIWDGSTDAVRVASSGVYFYRLRAGEFRASKKLVLLR